MPYQIVCLEENIPAHDLQSHLARTERRYPASNLRAPGEMLLEAARSDWKSDGPQGCILLFQRSDPNAEYEPDFLSPTGQSKKAADAGVLSLFLDSMCGPAESMLRRGQKVLVYEEES